jgi:hypothetical protein
VWVWCVGCEPWWFLGARSVRAGRTAGPVRGGPSRWRVPVSRR